MSAISMRPAPRVPAGSNSLAAHSTQGLGVCAKPTRRGILGGIAGVPIAAALGTIALPAMAQASGWRRAVARYRQAQFVSDAYERDHYKPAYEAWQARIAAVSPIVIPYTDAIGAPHEMRSDHEWSLWQARQVVTGKRKDEPSHISDLCRQFLDDVDARNARVEACRIPFDAIYDESERLDEITAEACEKVFTYPVGSVSDLAEKIDFLEERGIENDEAASKAVLADIRRLATREG